MRKLRSPRLPLWVWCAFLWFLSMMVVGLSVGYNYYLEQPAILYIAEAVGYIAPAGMVLGLVFKM